MSSSVFTIDEMSSSSLEPLTATSEFAGLPSAWSRLDPEISGEATEAVLSEVPGLAVSDDVGVGRRDVAEDVILGSLPEKSPIFRNSESISSLDFSNFISKDSNSFIFSTDLICLRPS